MRKRKFLSTTELAKILGVSRIAIYKKIRSGQIKAERVGRNFAISAGDLDEILGKKLTRKAKKEIDQAVERTVEEYGETLRLLAAE